MLKTLCSYVLQLGVTWMYFTWAIALAAISLALCNYRLALNMDLFSAMTAIFYVHIIIFTYERDREIIEIQNEWLDDS